jgi:thiol-disulfide isomerase/thioredoxin
MKVLKFGSLWCTECLVMRPMWKEIEEAVPGLITENYDADENEEELKRYGVKDIPVFVFLDKDNREFMRLEGVQNKEDLIKVVKENIDR